MSSASDAQWRRYIAIRERLRADAAVRRAYADLKRLARQFPDDRGAYTAAKETFIADLLASEEAADA